MPKHHSRRTPCSRSTRRNKSKIRRTRRYRGGRGGHSALTTAATQEEDNFFSVRF